MWLVLRNKLGLGCPLTQLPCPCSPRTRAAPGAPRPTRGRAGGWAFSSCLWAGALMVSIVLQLKDAPAFGPCRLWDYLRNGRLGLLLPRSV